MTRNAGRHSPTYPTGTVAVTVDENGIPHYGFAEDTAWEHLETTDVAAASGPF